MSPHTPENKAKACNDKKTVNTKDNILERTIIITVICFPFIQQPKTDRVVDYSIRNVSYSIISYLF